MAPPGSRSGLSALVLVAKSAVHGCGLFARRRICTGAHIGTFEGTPTKRDGEYVLWVLEDDGRRRGVLGRNVLRFLNHDAHPNAEFEGVELCAIRDVQPGAEIFIDYGKYWTGCKPAAEFGPIGLDDLRAGSRLRKEKESMEKKASVEKVVSYQLRFRQCPIRGRG